MKKEYFITGLFYEKEGYEFRKYLNIINRNYNCKDPDLMVVMMNPGSSKPLINSHRKDLEVEAIPDKTQNQIIKVMNTCKFNYARILNLSDLREPKSTIFYRKIEEMNSKGIAHSIFNKERIEDFNSLFVHNVPVIYGWGVNKNLSELAFNAMTRMDISSPIGIRKSNFEFAYYHPLPQNYLKQKEWVDRVTKMINNRQEH